MLIAARVAPMFLPFFFLELKAAKIPVSLREYLTLIEGLEAGWRATMSRVSTTFLPAQRW